MQKAETLERWSQISMQAGGLNQDICLSWQQEKRSVHLVVMYRYILGLMCDACLTFQEGIAGEVQMGSCT